MGNDDYSSLKPHKSVLFLLCDQVKNDEMGGASNTQGGDENAEKSVAGKPEGYRLLARPSRRWKHNITMDW